MGLKSTETLISALETKYTGILPNTSLKICKDLCWSSVFNIVLLNDVSLISRFFITLLFTLRFFVKTDTEIILIGYILSFLIKNGALYGSEVFRGMPTVAEILGQS